VLIKQLVNHSKDFYEISYWRILLNIFESNQFSCRCNMTNDNFIRGSTGIFTRISTNTDGEGKNASKRKTSKTKILQLAYFLLTIEITKSKLYFRTWMIHAAQNIGSIDGFQAALKTYRYYNLTLKCYIKEIMYKCIIAVNTEAFT
jgi:hypothetical protein